MKGRGIVSKEEDDEKKSRERERERERERKRGRERERERKEMRKRGGGGGERGKDTNRKRFIENQYQIFFQCINVCKVKLKRKKEEVGKWNRKENQIRTDTDIKQHRN